MYGYFCIVFIGFMLKDKSLTNFANLFPPNSFKMNDYIVLNYFKMFECNFIETPNTYTQILTL